MDTVWERPVSVWSDADVFQLRHAIDAATDMVFVTDDVPPADGGPFIRYANAAMAREFGLRPEQLFGKSPAFAFGPRTDPAIVDRLREAAIHAHDVQGELRAYRSDGTSFWSDWRGHIIPADGRHGPRWIAIGRNTDARRTAEDRLRMLSTAIEHANDAVFVYGFRGGDPHPRMRYANPAGLRQSGYGEAELLSGAGRRGPVAEPGLADDIVAAMTGGDPLRKRLRVYRKDGSHYWAGLHFEPIRDRAGGYSQWICIERDITDDVEREEARADLMAMIAHDLYNPLTTILGWAHVILESLPEGPNRVAAERIVRAGRRLESLAYELLTTSRIERRAYEPDVQHVDVSALLADVLAYMPGGERVAVVAPPHAAVRSDSVAIRHTLENLIGNALKFCPEPAPVDVLLEHADDGIVLRVHDTGIGIPAADLPHVFERAKRGANVGRRAGTGLGLSFVKNIVTSLRGQVSATSVEGGGSTFEVRLPNLAG